jgi:methionyl-tRNA synthetase
MTHAPKKIFAQLGLQEAELQVADPKFGEFPANRQVVKKGEPIFPRLDRDEEIAYIKQEMAKEQKPAATVETKAKPEINFNQFDEVEIRVAEILSVAKVEKADKLLKFEVDLGHNEHRQILSGIAEFYPEYQELVHHKVLAVTNLQPRKIRGEISNGMLLSSEDEQGKVRLALVGDEHPNGSLIG